MVITGKAEPFAAQPGGGGSEKCITKTKEDTSELNVLLLSHSDLKTLTAPALLLCCEKGAQIPPLWSLLHMQPISVLTENSDDFELKREVLSELSLLRCLLLKIKYSGCFGVMGLVGPNPATVG